MYIFLPFVIFIFTLLTIALIVVLYYDYKEYCLKETKPLAVVTYIKHIIFSKKDNAISENNKSWWQDPYLYVCIILFIVIGAVAYLAGLLTMVSIGYLLMLFN